MLKASSDYALNHRDEVFDAVAKQANIDRKFFDVSLAGQPICGTNPTNDPCDTQKVLETINEVSRRNVTESGFSNSNSVSGPVIRADGPILTLTTR